MQHPEQQQTDAQHNPVPIGAERRIGNDGEPDDQRRCQDQRHEQIEMQPYEECFNEVRPTQRHFGLEIQKQHQPQNERAEQQAEDVEGHQTKTRLEACCVTTGLHYLLGRH